MQLNLGNVDIRATMAAAAEGVQDRLAGPGLTLDISASQNIGAFTADERRVRQILFNLLANAVSFSPGGATITLRAERRADAVIFAVTDRGPGIPPEVLEKVFDWFESHSLGSQHRGPGLGLSLVRSFVELHGRAKNWPWWISSDRSSTAANGPKRLQTLSIRNSGCAVRSAHGAKSRLA